LILVSFVAVPQVPALLARVESEAHPMRSVGNCMVAVRAEEQAAGRPVQDLFVFLPTAFGHPLFYYFRPLGWERHVTLTDDELGTMAGRAGEARPVLMPKANFESVRWGTRWFPTPKPPYAEVSSVAVMVLPGPYARCAQ